MTTLALDFGNTRLKAAIFIEDRLEQVVVLEDERKLDLVIDKYHPNFSILSSVINHSDQTVKTLQERTRFHHLSNSSKLPFTIPVGKPETVGADRLALCSAATLLFPGGNNLVIGLGSCITYNFINAKSEFMGGSISPGMEMRFRAMHEFTAKLPLVKGAWNVPLIGYDTKSNLQSGVVLGMAAEIDGMVDKYEKRFGNFNVLLTGGDTSIFQPHLKSKIFADPHLIFKGLYAISKINVQV